MSGSDSRIRNSKQLRLSLFQSFQKELRSPQAINQPFIASRLWKRECSGPIPKRFSKEFHIQLKRLSASTSKLKVSKRSKKRQEPTWFGVIMKCTFLFQRSLISIRSMLWRHFSCSNFSVLFCGYSMSTGTTVYSTLVCSSFSRAQSSFKGNRTWKDLEWWEKSQSKSGCIGLTNGN